MLSRLLCRASGAESCSLSRALFTRYVSQSIFAPSRPKSTRVSHLMRDRPFNPVSKRLASDLSVGKQNGATLAKGTTNVALDLNTNVMNNVFLFKYDRPTYFKRLNGFAMFQLVFWLGICYSTCRELPAWDPKQSPLLKYCKDNFLIILVASMAFLVGALSSTLIWFFTARSVKYLILHKGGKTVTFVTYHPLKNSISTTVHTDTVKCENTKMKVKNYLPVKLEGHRFFYLLDAEGEFLNLELFNHTVGGLRK